MKFVSNIARYNGGAINVAAIAGFHNGVPIFELLNEAAFIFVNNLAGSGGNAVYLKFHTSLNAQICERIINFIFRLSFNRSITTVTRPYATSPYKVQLCTSASCNSTNTTNSCPISEKKNAWPI